MHDVSGACRYPRTASDTDRDDTLGGHHADGARCFPSTLAKGNNPGGPVIPLSEPFAAHFIVILQGSMKDQGHGGQPCIQKSVEFQVVYAFERGTCFMHCQRPGLFTEINQVVELSRHEHLGKAISIDLFDANMLVGVEVLKMIN